MPLPVVYRTKVGQDLGSAFDYYEQQGEGLGERFLGAVNSAFDAIERYPEMFASVHGEVRRALVSTSPMQSAWIESAKPRALDLALALTNELA